MSEAVGVGSLFSGYGGLSKAVEAVTGGVTLWVSDIDPGACAILAHRYPDVPNLGDISAIRWTPDCPDCGAATRVVWGEQPRDYEYGCVPCAKVWPPDIREPGMPVPVEVMDGGFPCQDVSSAGKRRGMVAGTRSGLWAMFARGIDAHRPKMVVIENVRGLLSADGEAWHDDLIAAGVEVDHLARVITLIRSKMNKHPGDREYVHRKKAELHRIVRRHKRALGIFKRERRLVQRAIATVLGDLADLGYDAQWHGLRASDVGAPHARYRIFITAHPAGHPPSFDGARSLTFGGRTGRPEDEARDAGRGAAQDTDGSARGERGLAASGQTEGGWARADASGRGGDAPDGLDDSLLPTPRARDAQPEGVDAGVARMERYSTSTLPTIAALLPTPGAADASGAVAHTGQNPTLRGAVEPERYQQHLHRNDPPLLPTPSAGAVAGQDPAARHRRGYGPELADITHLLPTPVANERERTQDEAERRRDDMGERSIDLTSAVTLLPTPMAGDPQRSQEGAQRRQDTQSGQADLGMVVQLLPTPSAADGDGTGRHNSPGHQSTLPGTVREEFTDDGELLPTPTAIMGRGSGSRSAEAVADARHQQSLLDLPHMLPTPRATRGGSATETAYLLDGNDRVGNELLPTPSAADGLGGHERRGGDRGDELLLGGAVKALLPTPRASDGEKGGPNQRGSSGDLMLPSAVQQIPGDGLLPTPTTDPISGNGHARDLGGEVKHLLPTPAVNDMGAGYTPESWDEWTAEQKAKHGNGNGHGPSLAIEAQRLLPTPTAWEQRTEDAEAETRNLLPIAVRLLPTPTSQAAKHDNDDRGPGTLDDANLWAVAAREAQWGKYAAAIGRWEAVTRPAPPATEESQRGGQRLSPRFVEWMMGLPDGWVTGDEVGLTRNQQLKALGNGVVPQEAHAALLWLAEIMAAYSR